MHIVNGDVAAATIKQAIGLSAQELIISRDILSCGPLPVFRSLDEWRHFRYSYWNTILQAACVDTYDYDSFFRDLYQCNDELAEAGQVNIWLGTGLSDQLQLVFLVFLFDYLKLDTNKISIYQFEKTDDRKMGVQGLGPLNPEQIKAHTEVVHLNENKADILRQVWQAINAPSPQKYLQIMANQRYQQSMPLLMRALGCLLNRYPDDQNGLSIFDEQLLKQVQARGPLSGAVIAHSIADNRRDLDLVGDLYLFSRLKGMAKPLLGKPLVEINAYDLPIKDTRVTLSETGKKVLEGQANAVKVNGIDDWVGGVHVDSSTGKIWYRVNQSLVRKSV